MNKGEPVNRADVNDIHNVADFLAQPWWVQVCVAVSAASVAAAFVYMIGSIGSSMLSNIVFRFSRRLAGTAQVLAVKTTGSIVGNTGYVCKIALRVQIPGREPYDVKATQTVDVTALSAVAPGATVPVEVVAAHPRRVRIDFNQPLRPQSGSWESPEGEQMGNLSKIASLHEQGLISDADFAAVSKGYAMRDALAQRQMQVTTPGSLPLGADLLASGQRVPGVLVSFSAHGDSAEDTYSRPELRGAPYYVLGVELHVPNLAPLIAQNIQPVPLSMLPKLALGLPLTCAIDPAAPAQLFVVDWGGSADRTADAVIGDSEPAQRRNRVTYEA